MRFLFLIFFVGLAAACSTYDNIMTQKGLRAGVGIEANSWLVGTKPTAAKLYIRDAVLFGLLFLPSMWGLAIGVSALFYPFLFPPFLLCLKHIQGGRQWRWMLLNPTKKLPQEETISQKFFGIWV